MKHDKTFEEFLKHSNLSQNTQTSYLWTVEYFQEHYDSFSKENLLAYKAFLLEYFKPKNFLENVISNADYQFLKTQLKNYARKYGISEKVVYPHSFRHRYAKNFLEKYSDIDLLADLMGHESIETTRIYLRRTASEQQEIVDIVVTW